MARRTGRLRVFVFLFDGVFYAVRQLPIDSEHFESQKVEAIHDQRSPDADHLLHLSDSDATRFAYILQPNRKSAIPNSGDEASAWMPVVNHRFVRAAVLLVPSHDKNCLEGE